MFHRFWSKVDASGGRDSCWPWIASCTEHGYGQFWISPTQVKAHRCAYELMIGPIPEGLTLDHLCRNRRCVNPLHLEPVTMRENILRGHGPAAANAAKDRCPRCASSFTTYWSKERGAWKRRCDRCAGDRQRERFRDQSYRERYNARQLITRAALREKRKAADSRG